MDGLLNELRKASAEWEERATIGIYDTATDERMFFVENVMDNLPGIINLINGQDEEERMNKKKKSVSYTIHDLVAALRTLDTEIMYYDAVNPPPNVSVEKAIRFLAGAIFYIGKHCNYGVFLQAQDNGSEYDVAHLEHEPQVYADAADEMENVKRIANHILCNGDTDGRINDGSIITKYQKSIEDARRVMADDATPRPGPKELNKLPPLLLQAGEVEIDADEDVYTSDEEAAAEYPGEQEDKRCYIMKVKAIEHAFNAVVECSFVGYTFTSLPAQQGLHPEATPIIEFINGLAVHPDQMNGMYYVDGVYLTVDGNKLLINQHDWVDVLGMYLQPESIRFGRDLALAREQDYFGPSTRALILPSAYDEVQWVEFKTLDAFIARRSSEFAEWRAGSRPHEWAGVIYSGCRYALHIPTGVIHEVNG